MIVNQPQLWWPIGSSSHQVGILYSLTITLSVDNHTLDSYSLPIGLRQVNWTSSGLLVNHQPVYLKGIARYVLKEYKYSKEKLSNILLAIITVY